jgi:hypothetical protein
VPIAFCDSSSFAEEWTFRYVDAALANARAEREIGLEIDGIR